MKDDYKRTLFDEIARNDPPVAKFIRDMHVNFNSKLHTFRWKREPIVVLCKYRREGT